MHKLLVSCLSALLIFCGCSQNGPRTLTVAATPVPHAEILEKVKGELLKRNIELEIIIIDDYNLPNRLLSDKEVNANFFQHLPFLEEQIRQFGYELTPIAKVLIEPMGLYSKKISALSDVPNQSTVVLPNDPTNESRALNLLEKAGLIKLRQEARQLATTDDILSNPKQLKLIEVDAPMLPRTLDEVTLAIIPSNFALQANLNPITDALLLEQADFSPYVNVLVVRKGDENRHDILALKEALTSEEVRAFILERYKGAVIPAF